MRTSGRSPFAVAAILGLVASAAAQDRFEDASDGRGQPELRVRIDFPGGSARIEAIDQATRTIRLTPAEHPGRGWACWWALRLDGVRPGETITLDVGGGPFARPDRASVRLEGRGWEHTGPGERRGDRIVYTHRIDADHALFAWGPTFTLEDAHELADRAASDCPDAVAFELCRSREGRPVPALRVGPPGDAGDNGPVAWVQARQHAWESGSSWVARGLVEWLVSDDPRAVRLREHATVYIVPIMDIDNVQRGAGGKQQEPHDHNRDWSDDPHWPEVRAALERISGLDRAGRLALFLDLHNPAPNDREPFFFVPPEVQMTPTSAEAQRAFLEAAAGEIRGPLAFRGKARPSGPEYDPQWERISKNRVKALTRESVVSACLEVPWNTPESTAANYRQAGQEIGRAIERYLGGLDVPGAGSTGQVSNDHEGPLRGGMQP